MRRLPLVLLAACGYSSHWPDYPEGSTVDDSAPVGTASYLVATPPCSTNDPGKDPSELEIVNPDDRSYLIFTVDPASCGEVWLTEVVPGGVWNGTVDTNLVFVVRGPMGGLVRWFGVPENSDWVETLP